MVKIYNSFNRCLVGSAQIEKCAGMHKITVWHPLCSEHNPCLWIFKALSTSSLLVISPIPIDMLSSLMFFYDTYIFYFFVSFTLFLFFSIPAGNFCRLHIWSWFTISFSRFFSCFLFDDNILLGKLAGSQWPFMFTTFDCLPKSFWARFDLIFSFFHCCLHLWLEVIWSISHWFPNLIELSLLSWMLKFHLPLHGSDF